MSTRPAINLQELDARWPTDYLEFPKDKKMIARLSLDLKQQWYACQDATQLIYTAESQEFKRFWFRHYLVPLRVKRLMYMFKFW